MDESSKTLEDAHQRSSYHRREIEKSRFCGCFYCKRTFPPTEIDEWCHEEQTAVCPYCGIDSVIGSASGHDIDDLFLERMNQYWF